jgi:hypothetical protein
MQDFDRPFGTALFCPAMLILNSHVASLDSSLRPADNALAIGPNDRVTQGIICCCKTESAIKILGRSPVADG